MAAWTLPYFLDAALEAPEQDSTDDPRDRAFAKHWHETQRDALRQRVDTLVGDTLLTRTLFTQILAERELTRAVDAAPVPRLYDAPWSDVAVVFVPGIFGELFDDEIWRRGLAAAREQLGVRIIPAATDGRCSTPDNATRVLEAMRTDTRRRLDRGYPRPRYLLLGYSKGGVDITEALARDTTLTREQVAAVVTIASPHGGTPVAERADLPDALLSFAIARPRPPSCDTTRAVESLWPANRAAFWAGPGRALGGLVPLLSISLASDLREAHPWMKVTKRIARFSESNDGVVTRSASRFPTAVASIDVGVTTGDHIAGRLASSFPQESFIEALLLTVNELGLLDADGATRWRDAVQRTRAASRRTDESTSRAVVRSARRAMADRTLFVIPGGGIGWRADRTYRMSNLEAIADRALPELRADALANGIVLHCDQPSMQDFRREYEFLYDAGNGGSELDPTNGFSIVESDSTESGRACRLRTHRSAMKMTTASIRFRPEAFSDFEMRLRVDRAVSGVAPDKGGRGRNDASLKLWLVLRDDRPASNGKRLLFGYTWAGVDARGQAPAADSLVEAGASRRRVGLSTLPEAWLVNIGGPTAEQQWLTIRRDLAADLQRAFPAIPLAALHVTAITSRAIRMTRGATPTSRFRPLRFVPRGAATTAVTILAKRIQLIWARTRLLTCDAVM